MKEIILFTLAISALISRGQTIIPKAGLSYSNLSNSHGKFKLGFSGGVGFNFPVKHNFSIQPELSFIQKGTRIKYNSKEKFRKEVFFTSVDNKLAINYLEIPVLAKFTFASQNKFQVVAGPSLGVGLGGRFKGYYHYVKTFDGGVIFSGSAKYDGTIEFRKYSGEDVGYEQGYIRHRLDIGIQMGAGVVLAEKIMIDLRYGVGLINLAQPGDGVDGGGTTKNSSLQLTVGIPLSLK